MTTMTMRPVRGMATSVETDAAARQLAQLIINPQRRHPLVVISADRSGTSSFEAEEIAIQLRITADVWTITAESTWTMNEALGSHKVYGDAAAVYPPMDGDRLRHRYFTAHDGHSNASVIDVAREAGRAPATRSKPLMTGRVADLEAQVRAHETEIGALLREIRDGDRERAVLRKRVEEFRAARGHAARMSKNMGAPGHVHGFTDPEEQLRWDIRHTWVEMTRPEEKGEWPLAYDFLVGPEFTRTVDELEGVSRHRILTVLVRVLSGRGVPDDHPLRSGKAGGAPPVTRTIDGVEWICRRAPLQQSSPSARRLSYWRSPSGQIELSRVTVHDDLTP